MKKSLVKVIACICALTVIVSIASAIVVGAKVYITPQYPVPTMDLTNNGNNIKKTMNLLQTSTAEHPNEVRITVYGQSISSSDNQWTTELRDYLQEKYPTAKIIWSNLAIGGFATQYLKRMVANDMKVNYPDLVLLMDYGNESEYREIVKYIRENTTAEMILQTPHVGATNNNTAPEDGTLSYQNDTWITILNDIGKEYGCDVADIRNAWKKYLSNNNVQSYTLLKDGIHLNDQGQALMFNLIKQCFVYKSSGITQSVIKEKEYAVGTDVKWANGKLILPFTGNRIELIAADGSVVNNASASVLIDDKAPSQYLNLYYYTRIFKLNAATKEPDYWAARSGLVYAKLNKIPKLEDWTLTVNSLGSGAFNYSLKGSITGDEGIGTDSDYYTTKSGTWTISPADFKFDANSSGQNVIYPDTVYSFSTKLNGADVYSDAAAGTSTCVASGLANGAHTLQLVAKDATKLPTIKAIRIYNPAEGKVLPSSKTYKSYVKTKLYKAANTTKKVKDIAKGKTLSYKGTKGKFFKVVYAGQTGYVKISDVVISGTWTKSIKSTVKAKKSPSASAKNTITYKKGKTYKFEKIVGNYYKVKGKTAWILSKYLK